MPVHIHCNAYIRMAHKVLKCFRIHPGFRLITTVGVPAYMRSDVWHALYCPTLQRVASLSNWPAMADEQYPNHPLISSFSLYLLGFSRPFFGLF